MIRSKSKHLLVRKGRADRPLLLSLRCSFGAFSTLLGAKLAQKVSDAGRKHSVAPPPLMVMKAARRHQEARLAPFCSTVRRKVDDGELQRSLSTGEKPFWPDAAQTLRPIKART